MVYELKINSSGEAFNYRKVQFMEGRRRALVETAGFLSRFFLGAAQCLFS
jgi:hypothetical protein